jgi:hypothetical protein
MDVPPIGDKKWSLCNKPLINFCNVRNYEGKTQYSELLRRNELFLKKFTIKGDPLWIAEKVRPTIEFKP